MAASDGGWTVKECDNEMKFVCEYEPCKYKLYYWQYVVHIVLYCIAWDGKGWSSQAT